MTEPGKSPLQQENNRKTDHLHQVFSNNGYRLPFICSALKESPEGGREGRRGKDEGNGRK